MSPSTRPRRGFTLIEMALATALGLLVIFTALGVFSAMRAGWDRSQTRNQAALEMSRLRVALQETFRGVIVLPKQRTGARPGAAGAPINSGLPPNPDAATKPGSAKPATPPRSGPGEAGRDAAPRKPGSSALNLPPGVDVPADDGSDAGSVVPGAPPRLLLEETPTGVQRLEMVVLRSPTIAASADHSSTLPNSEVGGGVRGGFELRPSLDGPGYDIWWRTYPIDQGPDGPRQPLGEARIARGFVQLRWTFVKSDANRQLQWLTTASATDASELPAYVELEAQTRLGLKAKWMFEVGWVQSRAQDAAGDLPTSVAERLDGIDLITGEPRKPGSEPGPGAGAPQAPYGWQRGADGRALDSSVAGGAPWSSSFGPDGRPVPR